MYEHEADTCECALAAADNERGGRQTQWPHQAGSAHEASARHSRHRRPHRRRPGPTLPTRTTGCCSARPVHLWTGHAAAQSIPPQKEGLRCASAARCAAQAGTAWDGGEGGGQAQVS